MKCFFVVIFLACMSVQGLTFHETVKKHCIECHNNSKRKGDVSLEVFKDTEDFYTHYDTLKDLYQQVKSGDMPPKEDSEMSSNEREYLVGYLDRIIKKLENTASENIGQTKIRRLTPYEYDNTLKSITGLDLKLSENFPIESGSGEGFTNDSSLLGVSPLLFEKYLAAAETISTFSSFDFKKGFSFSDKNISLRSKKEIVAQLENEISFILKDIYPKGFTLKKYLPKLMIAVNDYNRSGKKAERISEISKIYGINKFFLKRGIQYFSSSSGKGIIERDAIIPWFGLKQLKYDQKQAVKLSKDFTQSYLDALKEIDNVSEIKMKSYLDFKHNIKAIFTYTDAELLTLIQKSKIEKYKSLNATIDFLEFGLRSKYRSEMGKKIIPHIRSLLSKAYRQPADEKEVIQKTKDFINDSVKFGIDVATKILVVRTFVNMKFIFRFERNLGKRTRVTDFELASRLSYFLWSSAPDEELLKLASEGKLSDIKVLEQQVKRMIKDRKSSALAKYFAAQWLKFGDILDFEGPDPEKFPEFDRQLAKDMWKESAICFEYLVKNDRSVLEVFDADYTFLNGRLKKHYGLGGGSSGFQKVMLKDKKRGGILTHASILASTSPSLRTSPILRGNWVLTSLLGTPSPPAPANVDPLPNEEVVSEKLSLKKQLEQHRKSPKCKGCHQRIDPMGFPLENYDVLGRWRNRYKSAAIDKTGDLRGGEKIEGPIGLKKYLMKEKEVFLKNMSRKLLGYALGRSIQYYDFYIINKMVTSLKKNNFKFSTMVWEIVKSDQFQYKN